MKTTLLSLLLIIASLACKAQQINGIVKDSANHKPIDYVSVVVYNASKQPICFQHSDEKGRFSLTVPEGKQGSYITFTILGYAKRTYPITRFKNGQTIWMREAATQIKQVTVKSKRLQLRSDTLVYSVAGFRQKQDRSIADVIAKMPGLKVEENGGISYQGKPINKFYIEGMDLMGSKYAMASENISADKVKNVEVLQNHQPVKTLKNIQFSDQAALNIVLTDEAKSVWNGTLDMGMGAPMQKGMGEKWLRDGRLIGMRFSKKTQCIAMYKWNNTGKDIMHEILDLSRESQLMDAPTNWLYSITPGTSALERHRYKFNDTHILATNWLRKLDNDKELRLQSSFLHDKTIGNEYTSTTYTNIAGMPMTEQENDVHNYRNELTTELQYKLNANKNYIKNLFRSTFTWDEDKSATILNGKTVKQDIEPRRIFFGDDFQLIHNLGNDKAFSLKAIGYFQKLPSKLLLLDESWQKLDLTEYHLDASTSFRHKILGFNISYEANVSYNRQEASLNHAAAKDYFEESKGTLIPHISYAGLGGLELSASLPLRIANYKLSNSQKTKLYCDPGFNIGYKFTATTTLRAGYQYSHTLMPFSMTTSLPYYASYISMINGDGNVAELNSHYTWGKFEYGNPLIGLFYNLSANYSYTSGMPLYTFWMDGDVYHSKISDLRSNNGMWTLSTDLSKSFGLGKLTVGIGGDATINNYDMLLADNKQPYQSRNIKAHVNVAFMPSPLFSVEEKSTFNYSKQINKQDHTADTQALRSFQHNLSLFFMPGKWQFEWKHELYHSNDKSVSTSLFSDIKISYKKRRYEWSITLNNLYGTKEFKRRYISDNYIEYCINQLRCREFLFKISCYL